MTTASAHSDVRLDAVDTPRATRWSAGCSTSQLRDEVRGVDGVDFPVVVMYPALAAEAPHALGPFRVDVAADAPIAPGEFPLVVISHGKGGSHLLYRGLAIHLARHGYVVCLPEHPFDNRNDNSLSGSVATLSNRPRHLRTVVDWAYAAAPFAARLKPDCVAVIGHSMGGYTALALAGGRPTSTSFDVPAGPPVTLEVARDDRVRALVLLAPATPWFMRENALSQVTLPILMLSAEKDAYTPAFHAEVVLNGVADKSQVRHRIVDGAGHFSFLAPFPEAMRSGAFPPSQDPQGFDRERFHVALNAEVLDFLNRTL